MTESEMVCLKFGLITEETDVEELVGMVQNIGKEVEQSSKVGCKKTDEPRCEKTGFRGFRPGPTQTRAVQSQKMARGLKFRIQIEEKLHNPCGENKGADQLCSYRTTGLRPCFRICKNPVFS